MSKKEITVEDNGKGREDAIAKVALNPAVSASISIEKLRGKDLVDSNIHALMSELAVQINATNKGDLSRSEAMLISQAHTLDTIFHVLCVRSIANMGEYIGAAETYMRLALKAQSQSQATLRTLGELKSPKNIAFVKQANIAENQQINNGSSIRADGDLAGENKKPPNELLEEKHDQRVDGGAKTASARVDKALETVEEVERPQKSGRKGQVL